MKRIIIFLIIALVLTASVFSEDFFGFQYEFAFGLTKNDLFNLYDTYGQIQEWAVLGNNGFMDLDMRFFVWRFFLGLQTEWLFYSVYTNVHKQMWGASVGWVPIDFLTAEIGWKYKDSYTLAAPYQYHVNNHNFYIKLSGKVGNVK